MDKGMNLGAPLVLASQSQSRQSMLAAAGVAFEAVPALLVERGLEAELAELGSDQVALRLADFKEILPRKL